MTNVNLETLDSKGGFRRRESLFHAIPPFKVLQWLPITLGLKSELLVKRMSYALTSSCSSHTRPPWSLSSHAGQPSSPEPGLLCYLFLLHGQLCPQRSTWLNALIIQVSSQISLAQTGPLWPVTWTSHPTLPSHILFYFLHKYNMKRSYSLCIYWIVCVCVFTGSFLPLSHTHTHPTRAGILPVLLSGTYIRDWCKLFNIFLFHEWMNEWTKSLLQPGLNRHHLKVKCLLEKT